MQDKDRDPTKTSDDRVLEESISNLLAGARVKFVREPSHRWLKARLYCLWPARTDYTIRGKDLLEKTRS
jgi:hypothetical protein